MGDLNSLSAEQLKTLIEANARISSNYSDMNALLVSILESAMRLVQCESSSLLLLHGGDGSLRFAAALGPKGAEVLDIPVTKNSVAGWVTEHDEPLVLNNVASDPRFSAFVQNKTGYVSRNMTALPLRVNGKCIGVIELLNKAGASAFNDDDLAALETFAEQAGIAYGNACSYRSAEDKISALSSKIVVGAEYHSFVAKSPAVLDLLRVIEEVADTGMTVLITGESGAGKELLAEQLHIKSSRRDKPFVRVNCAALPPDLFESGLFEKSSGGTIFFDEIGCLPPDLQAKLLGVLQAHRIAEVGSDEAAPADARFVAATRCNLERMVGDGLFRSDLYYRLNVVPLNVPPLRERKDDIEPLASFFLEEFSRETKKNFRGFSETALRVMRDCYWPGNVRELRNSVERACMLGKPPVIQADDLRISIVSSSSGFDGAFADGEFSSLAAELACGDDKTLRTAVSRFKAAYIKRILDETSWNQTKAGRILGIQRTYVSRLLNELNIR